MKSAKKNIESTISELTDIIQKKKRDGEDASLEIAELSNFEELLSLYRIYESSDDKGHYYY